MAITVITDKDIGFGLHIAENKLAVNVEDLAIPVDVKLAGVDIDKDGKTMKFTLSDDSVIERDISDFLAVDTDTKIVEGRFDVDGQSLILTDSEGEEIPVDFAGLVDFILGEVEQALQDVSNGAKEAADAAKEVAEAAQAAADAAKEAADQAAKDSADADAEQDKEIEALKAEIEALKAAKPTGIQVLSLGGEELGYLVSAADVA